MRELKNMAARRLLCKLTPFRSLICREQNVSRFLRLQRPSLSHSVNMRLFHSSGAPLSDGTDSNDRTELQSEEGPTPPPPALTGRLHMTYTCKVCGRRSGREFSKQAYTGGVVLIQCPGCESLHLVADNLGWFNQKNRNIEDILAEKGEAVLRIDDTTLEVKGEDVVGTLKLKSAVDK